MSLAVFENFLSFAERSLVAKAGLPPAIDPAEFENALVSYGVVMLHAHMEQCLRSAIEARCVRCVDLPIRTFALSVRDEKSGKLGIDALKGTLGRFSDVYKTMFKDSIDKSDPERSWVSVMSQRAVVAHGGQPATCSLADLRLYYEDIRKVLGFFCNALGLNAAEVTGISILIVLPASPALAVPVPVVPVP